MNGSYAALSGHYYMDDRIDEVGEQAELLFLRVLAFCAATMSDGFVSDRQLRRGPGIGLDHVDDRCKALVAAGLWAHDDDRQGFIVVNYLKWNKSREDIVTFRAREAARKREYRLQQLQATSAGTSQRTSDGTSAGSPHAKHTSHNSHNSDNSHTESGRAQEPARPDSSRVPAPPPPQMAELRQRLDAQAKVRRARGGGR